MSDNIHGVLPIRKLTEPWYLELGGGFLFIFLKIYLLEWEYKWVGGARERDSQTPQWMQSLRRALISQPWHHDLSLNQELDV